MNILLMGPQGSGKGTQARLICEKFNFFYFESGAYLRKVAEKNPELKEWMSKGVLVPDREMTSYLTAYLDEKNIYDNIIFDGFPRTVSQYHFLKNWLNDKHVKIDLAIVLEIKEIETIRRLAARRIDSKTGEIYNLITDKPPVGVDVASLIHREDDKPDAIKRRLALYKAQTELLISEYQKEMKVVEVNGERPIATISQEIIGIIESQLKNTNGS